MNVQGFPESGCIFRDTPFLPFGFHGVEYCRAEIEPHSCPNEQVPPMSYFAAVCI